MSPIQGNNSNNELAELGTHAAAATNLHRTRTTEEPVQIQPPVGGSPGPLDNRSHRYDNKKNGKPI
ncbi:hypothetical protein P9314_13430 [Paenibacillus validus]|uniref:Uncharacterized protein n=1 Tax=Paenibacillus validus TaxID=44253 RepID=A0A7X2ZE45_9BACL|nr:MULTISPECIES: hypothetical protein [Paenibacillus]MED4601704.1 hypothetical protein [Paenibacillus validus]MED4607786.1 hypothetical protein [Paenibacillus validus]MUG73143.1 hypothetical protein [Paenibacillus validus]